jgi:ComF family protein
MTKSISIFKDFFELFYPHLCMACDAHLIDQETVLCTKCLYELPRTNYHIDSENPINQLFWGRTNISNATAYYHFTKGSKFQKLIHKLKYQGHKEIGQFLGKQLAYDIIEDEKYSDIDYVIPVPLHPKKERKRGYNQSDHIAIGIAEVYQIEADTKSLIRKVQTETQTKKSRVERWKNVDSIFELKQKEKFINKHILIVDDVITTGSTIEACVQSFINIEGIRVSVAALAAAK